MNLSEGLIANGHAYAVDGDVYFQRVPHLPQYGQLTRQKLEDMMVGARAASSGTKRIGESAKNIRQILLFGKVMRQAPTPVNIKALGTI